MEAQLPLRDDVRESVETDNAKTPTNPNAMDVDEVVNATPGRTPGRTPGPKDGVSKGEYEIMKGIVEQLTALEERYDYAFIQTQYNPN